MNSLKSYISKKIVSIKEGKEVGYVLDCVLDESLKKLQGFLIVDDESEEEYFLPVAKIKAENQELLFIEEAFDAQFYDGERSNNPIGKQVFDANGNSFGRVEDGLLNANFTLQKLITDRCEIAPKYIMTNGEKFLFYGTKKKNNKKNTNIFENYQINSQKIQENLPKIKIQTNIDNKNITKPERIFSSTKMLLNRIATSDCYGFNNELIVKKFQLIDENIIKKAKKHNKINFLFFNSK